MMSRSRDTAIQFNPDPCQISSSEIGTGCAQHERARPSLTAKYRVQAVAINRPALGFALSPTETLVRSRGFIPDHYVALIQQSLWCGQFNGCVCSAAHAGGCLSNVYSTCALPDDLAAPRQVATAMILIRRGVGRRRHTNQTGGLAPQAGNNIGACSDHRNEPGPPPDFRDSAHDQIDPVGLQQLAQARSPMPRRIIDNISFCGPTLTVLAHQYAIGPRLLALRSSRSSFCASIRAVRQLVLTARLRQPCLRCLASRRSRSSSYKRR